MKKDKKQTQTAGKKSGRVKDLKGTVRRLTKILLDGYRLQFLAVILLIMASSYATLRGSLFLKDLVDLYITPMISTGSRDYGSLAHALIQLALFYLMGIICSYAYNRIMVSISQGTMQKIRLQVFSHMESLSISYFDTHAHGDIMSVYTNDVDTLHQLISQSIPQTVSAAITIVMTFISMLILNIPLTLVTVLMIFFTLKISAFLAGKASSCFVDQQKHLGTLNGFIEEMISGQKVVKVFNHEEKSLEQFRLLNEQLRLASGQAGNFTNIMMPVNGNLAYLSYVLCAISGALLVMISGSSGNTGIWKYFSLSLGSLIAFLTLNRNFSMPVSQLSQQMSSIIGAAAGAERIFALLDAPSETDEGYVELVNSRKGKDGSILEASGHTGSWAWRYPHRSTGEITYREMRGKVTFDHVHFGYDPEKEILHDISLYAEPGQKIAFVGSTGAGKTTITNLINRFYEIQSGTITYDDIDIKKIRKNDLRRSLGMVLQDTHLFTGTVMENIRFGRLDASDQECIAAARLANAHGFIKRLPDGYNTQLKGDGSNLSQGQRQLLAIARAAISDPPVLILDEATSSIDTRTESLVQSGMDKLMSDRTTFVIAHRLSTVRNADCIMVLEQGRIIERGTHESLLAEKGKYYQLYTGVGLGA